MTVVVASVPAGHVYVRHLAVPHEHPRVVRLPDPPAGAAAGAPWWPPPMLDPEWVRSHVDDFDLMHIHFGFDHLSPKTLAELVAALREVGKPLVLTVHDLRNPHHADPELHDAQLDVLVSAADALVTLTHGAAGEISDRWGREAWVLPHPHVVDETTMRRPRPEREGFVVGIHVKSLRASMDPLPVVEEVVDAVRAMPGASLRVDAHTDVMDATGPRHEPGLASRLRELAVSGALELRVHDYFSDAELWDYLRSLDVSLLPYRFGTHSGWLEACYDLGTTVLAPNRGYYAQQRPCVTYAVPASPAPPGVPALRDALAFVHRERPHWQADPESRRRERRGLDRAHERIYTDAVEGAVPCTSSS